MHIKHIIHVVNTYPAIVNAANVLLAMLDHVNCIIRVSVNQSVIPTLLPSNIINTWTVSFLYMG